MILQISIYCSSSPNYVIIYSSSSPIYVIIYSRSSPNYVINYSSFSPICVIFYSRFFLFFFFDLNQVQKGFFSTFWISLILIPLFISSTLLFIGRYAFTNFVSISSIPFPSLQEILKFNNWYYFASCLCSSSVTSWERNKSDLLPTNAKTKNILFIYLLEYSGQCFCISSIQYLDRLSKDFFSVILKISKTKTAFL